jgi:hypothetical protein
VIRADRSGRQLLAIRWNWLWCLAELRPLEAAISKTKHSGDAPANGSDPSEPSTRSCEMIEGQRRNVLPGERDRRANMPA